MPLAHTERVYQQMKQWIDEAGLTHELVVYDDADIDFSVQRTVLSIVSENSQATPSRSSSLSKQEMIAGALDLMAVGFEKTVDAVEKVHLSIAKEPHIILKKIPVVESVSKVVDSNHIGVAEAVYRSVRQGGKLIHAAADLMRTR